ncbi:MAG: crotonase [Proteobacteria bacterium TMED261]|nr:MAG: crotonase [Proteobacteria bacterium TMED261]
MTEILTVETLGAVARLTLNDPPYNRMSLAFMDELEHQVKKISENDEIRSVLLTSTGTDNFSVGMNLKQLPEGIKKMGSAEAVFEQRLRVIRSIETMGKPWVATLFGYCLGGGLEIPLGCHFRLAAEANAQIGLPELDLGAVPAWGGSARLTKCVGEHYALDMILRAKKISGPEAFRIGLVHEVWPIDQLKDKALELAQALSEMPAQAVKSMLNVIVDGREKTLTQLIEAEKKAVVENRGTPDAQEGMLAFLEKREPFFNQKQKS